MEIDGRIVKGIAGFYYVYTDELGIVECHAKGLFRKEKKKPLVGDYVSVSILDEEKKEGSLIAINERHNYLIRPEVANVDRALIVFAAASPEPNWMLLDKFLVMMQKYDIETIICFNKNDLVSAERIQEIESNYAKSGAKVIATCAKSGEGIDSIKQHLTGRTTVLAGPSGVGKSSIINQICPMARMETGHISTKTKRGKHTTRHSELFYVGENTFIMDTPGFTAFELTENIDKDELKDYYPEFYKYEGACRYEPCSHTHEPSCSVKAAVGEGIISKLRYGNYCQLYEEIKNRRLY